MTKLLRQMTGNQNEGRDETGLPNMEDANSALFQLPQLQILSTFLYSFQTLESHFTS